MRSAWSACAVALLGGLAGWVLFTRSTGAEGAVLGVLAAGGWGLGLVPVHSKHNSARRKTGTLNVFPERQLQRPDDAD